MRLLTMNFLEHYSMRVINLHPALPGTFPGTHAIERAYEAFQSGKIKHTGVMVHFVPDEGMDDGPVIAQEIIPIQSTDTVEELEERIHKVEHRLLVTALQQVFQS
jgi:phosphoribosylglycinamide formyltransferase-1